MTYPPNLIEFLLLNIPQSKPREDGFLDIIDHTYKENTISQVYNYFLSRDKSEILAKLFLSSLMDLLGCADLEMEMTGHESSTEVASKKGRIDILIQNKTKEESIIIENKIYHWLHNDLEDYWNSVDSKKKVGVVLTLYKQNIPDQLKTRYKSITHMEWLTRIKEMGFPPGLNTKQYVYLNDFIANMELLTKSKDMNEPAKFYFEHLDKIKLAINTENEAYHYVYNQIDTAAEELKWARDGSGESYRYIWDNKQEEIYYAIVFDKLFTDEKEITIIIELHKNAIPKYESLLNLVKDKLAISNLQQSTGGGTGWKHLVHKVYPVKMNDIENLSQFIYDAITGDFKLIMEELIQYHLRK